MRYFWIGFGVGIILILLVVSLYFYMGFYNVTASAKSALIENTLQIVRTNSIKRQIGRQPLTISENGASVTIAKGATGYMGSCVLCHGAPGYDRQAFATCMTPDPPDLSKKEITGALSDAEIFWIISNGIGMTGMPFFKTLASVDDIKSYVLFVKNLPNLTKDDIDKLLNQ